MSRKSILVDESKIKTFADGMPFTDRDRERGVGRRFTCKKIVTSLYTNFRDGVMRVLMIPDIHLKPWIFDRTEKNLKRR